MFYDAVANSHGLKRDPWKAIIAPRPIGWISSIDRDGRVNLAPYSFFNAISDRPHYVCFASDGRKDSVRNIEETGEFVCSLATHPLRCAMNTTSAPVARGVDELALAGLTAAPCRLVKPPRVAESPAAVECRHWRTIELPSAEPGGRAGYLLVIGLVVGIHIDDAFIKDGIVDTAAMLPLARLGYMDYAVTRADTVLSLDRPTVDAEGRIVAPATGG